jgi:Rps23 Pro-64 3,4-dihydroxylase Tpa1-like proline 4-hydroxylase
MMNAFNSHYFEEGAIAKLQKEFNESKPYRHLMMDGFLNAELADSLYNNFPSVEKLNKHYHGLNEQKSEGSNFSDFHPDFTVLRGSLMSKDLYQWLSKVTGIEDVFITDDNLGTGLHQGANGSFLDIHIDFNIHNKLNVHRRLNLLIYMNKGWQTSWGGQLEMWNADMTQLIKSVNPEFNRCVIFETSEISYHGYSKITVPEGVTRKSFYSYFYTKERMGAAKFHDTVFKAKPEDSTAKKVKTTVKENLKNFTKKQLKKVGINL